MMRTASTEIQSDRCASRCHGACLRLSLLVTVVIGPAVTLPGRGVIVSAQEVIKEQPSKDGLGPGAVRSLLEIRTGKDKNGRSLVVLGRPAYGGFSSNEQRLEIDQAILPREMVRQAMLIAARDEMGLLTRDEVIDDTEFQREGAPPASAEVVSFIRDQVWHAQVRPVGKDQNKHLRDYETQGSKEHIVDLLKLTVAAEALSRQEFPRALKDLGLAGKPNDRK